MERVQYRTGLGWDAHRLEPGTALYVGGVAVPGPVASQAHSDGDAALHALADAILSAVGEPDLGELFPDTAEENRARPSADFVRAALDRAAKGGWRVENASVVVRLERPNLGARKAEIRAWLAALLGVETGQVGFAAKTGEGAGPVGEGTMWEAQASVLLARVEAPES